MNLRKNILTSVAASAMGWSVAANATPNVPMAIDMYNTFTTDIQNQCVLYWSYAEPEFSNCVAENTYITGWSCYEAGDIFEGDLRDTWILVGDWLWYGP